MFILAVCLYRTAGNLETPNEVQEAEDGEKEGEENSKTVDTSNDVESPDHAHTATTSTPGPNEPTPQRKLCVQYIYNPAYVYEHVGQLFRAARLSLVQCSTRSSVYMHATIFM